MVRNLLEHHFHIQTWDFGPNTTIRFKAPGLLDLGRYPEAKIHAQKTHSPRTHGKAPALVLIRDPRDAFVSLSHFNRELLETKHNSLEAGFRSSITNRAWSNFYTFWIHQRGNIKVEFIKYEDCLEYIKQGTIATFLSSALASININTDIVDPSPLPKFETYHKVRPKFYRRGVIGGWRDELSEDLAELAWKNHGAVAEVFGYSK